MVAHNITYYRCKLLVILHTFHYGLSSQVIPRQTCGLFTHTILKEKYPGGRKQFDINIYGGELFKTFILNIVRMLYYLTIASLKKTYQFWITLIFHTSLFCQVLVFMTHMSNYGNDRLAIQTFQNVINFVQTRTNLKLISKPPVELARIYFDMYPEESSPIWTV